MNHGTQKRHGLEHFMAELIKYIATTISSINKQHALKKSCLGMVILENKKNTKNTDTLEQNNIATIFCRIAMQKYKDKHSLKIWSENLKDR